MKYSLEIEGDGPLKGFMRIALFDDYYEGRLAMHQEKAETPDGKFRLVRVRIF